jgi:hypothetical protein
MTAKKSVLTLLVLVAAMLMAAPAAASTSFVVNDSGDAIDLLAGNGACDTDLVTPGDQCTLRAAIGEANGQAGNGPFTITFSLPASTTIQTTGGISAGAGKQIQIDGCGATAGNDPCVGLKSSTASAILAFQASSTVSGLAISSSANASEGVFSTAGAMTVKRSWLGIGLDGSAGALGTGVRLQGDNGVIGGTTPAERNVFANDTTGVLVESGDNTVVRGNYFGVNSTGTTVGVSGNGTNVALSRSNAMDPPNNTVIGGTLDATAQGTAACDGACNLIARATSRGIDLDGGGGLTAGPTTIAGNYVGTTLDGTANLQNTTAGIDVGDANQVLVGGPTTGDRNVIAGSTFGVLEGTGGGGGLTIRNNYIGTNAAGTAGLPAVNNAVLLTGTNAAPSALIDNVITHAAGTGSAIGLSGSGATVTGNSIGVGSGGQDLPMGGAIRITGNDNVIGGAGAGDANVIGNVNLVAAITVDAGNGNTIIGNDIGVDGNGGARPNLAGVRIRTNFGVDSTNNVVGGNQPGEANVISNSTKDAVLIAGAGTGNSVLRNRGSSNGQQFIDVGSQGANDTDGNGPGNPGAENGGVLAPQISGTPTTLAASGTAAPNATVRVFITPSANGADPSAISTFVGEATANGGGAWSLTYSLPIPNDSNITANQTLSDGSSGELTTAVTVADATPPQTSIGTGPSGLIADATPTWTFSSEPGATFECRIDGGSFTPCASPFTPAAALADGQHTFRVRALDDSPAHNADPTPATRTVTVDTTAPQTTITSGPSGPTRDATPTFGFKAGEPGSTFQCKLDAGPWAACSSPRTTATLADGTHAFRVRAKDAAGNIDPTPAKRSVKVDTHRPASKAAAPASTHSSPITVSYTASDAAPSSQLGRVELWAKRQGQPAYSKVATDTTPITTRTFSYKPSGGGGTYRFYTRAKDKAGNYEAAPATPDASTVFSP